MAATSNPLPDDVRCKQHIQLLYERILEPVFIPKGKTMSVFDVPDEYLTDRYKPIKAQIIKRFEGRVKEHIPVTTVHPLPDMSLVGQLDRNAPFSLFVPYHRSMAEALVEMFMGAKGVCELLSLALYVRDRCNPFLFIYALSVALLHRPDTRDVPVPSPVHVFPGQYMDSAVFTQAKEVAVCVPEEAREPVEIPRNYTANDLEIEHRLAYFREDLGINMHHWHWHITYPLAGNPAIVNKDRRGELFYYMHHQMLARYNFERLSNHLARVERIMCWDEPLLEGYFPKLDSTVASRIWPPRQANTICSDIRREAQQMVFDKKDLERWNDRIFECIHKGAYIDRQGNTQRLTEMKGIDDLGNMVESSMLSVNPFYYGDLHNTGHMLIALCHDPDGRHLESFQVMGTPGTAMRDPIFYRWHATIDDIFNEHKNLLPRYTVQQLDFPGCRIISCEIDIKGQAKNMCLTLWQKSDVNLALGMDFTPREDVYARFTHLQHIPFKYRIKCQNDGAQRMGTCRIFLSPKFDERGEPWLFRDQKNMFIEMDRFTVNLKPGPNEVVRESKDSSVILPYETTFRNLDEAPTTGPAFRDWIICGCGWPEHMLVPRGNAAGLACELFVMISDYEMDKVERNNVTPNPYCEKDATSFCGLRDNLYPDRRSMGFPFDRMPRQGVTTLAQFMTPNMCLQDVTIRFTDRTITPKPHSYLGPHA